MQGLQTIFHSKMDSLGMKQETLAVPMPRCQAFKRDQTPCSKDATRSAADTHPLDLHLCGTHKNSYARTVELDTAHVHYTPGRCFHTINILIQHGPQQHVNVTRWCTFPAIAGHTLCTMHEENRVQFLERNQRRHDARAVVTGLVEGLVEQDPPVPWQRAVRVLVAAADIRIEHRRAAAEAYFRLTRTRLLEPEVIEGGPWMFRTYWNWVVGGGVGQEPHVDQPPPPPAPPTGVLGALARDNQNVHTRVVSDQTNAATAKLRAVKVPESQQTEKTLALIWLGTLDVSFARYLPVSIDINRWFNTKDCREANDNLYRKLLRGLVALIGAEKEDERRAEMYRRLWEECYESMNMCCEGHISRLCNVLVGFDDAFQPPVSFGEILQSKMAAIAGLDIPDEEKRRQANAFFDEHQTPAEERVAWLEAF
jgi:hypothetical protein